jgi:hypothetical protein
MAQAVNAGARGEDTEATIRLEQTAHDLGATQALPRTEYAERRSDPTMVAPLPASQRDPARRARTSREPQRRQRKKRSGRALAVLVWLLLLGSGAAVAYALIESSDGGGIDAPNADSPREQILELKDLINQYRE